MNDIETINRANERAVAEAIPHILARGHFAVLEYSGLQLVNVHEHDSGAEANQHACALGLKPGKRAEIRGPSQVQLEDASPAAEAPAQVIVAPVLIVASNNAGQPVEVDTLPSESEPYSGPDFDPS